MSDPVVMVRTPARTAASRPIRVSHAHVGAQATQGHGGLGERGPDSEEQVGRSGAWWSMQRMHEHCRLSNSSKG